MSLEVYSYDSGRVEMKHTSTLLMKELEAMDQIGSAFKAVSNGQIVTTELKSPVFPAVTAACVSATSLTFGAVINELQQIFKALTYQNVQQGALILGYILTTPYDKIKFTIEPVGTTYKGAQVMGTQRFSLQCGTMKIPIQEVLSAIRFYLNAAKEIPKGNPVQTSYAIFFENKDLGGAESYLSESAAKKAALEELKKSDPNAKEDDIKSIPLIHVDNTTYSPPSEQDIPNFFKTVKDVKGLKFQGAELAQIADTVKLNEGWLIANGKPIVIKVNKIYYKVTGNGLDMVTHAWRWFYALLGIVARKLLLAILQSDIIKYKADTSKSLADLFNPIVPDEIDKLIHDLDHKTMYTQWANLMYGVDWLQKCISKANGVFILDVIANYPESLFPVYGAQNVPLFLEGFNGAAVDFEKSWQSNIFSSFVGNMMSVISEIKAEILGLKPNIVITTSGGNNFWNSLNASGVSDARALDIAGHKIVWSRPVYNSNLWFVGGFEKRLWLVTHKSTGFTKKDDIITEDLRTIIINGMFPNYSLIRRGRINSLEGQTDILLTSLGQEGEYLVLSGPIKNQYALEVMYNDLQSMFLPPYAHGVASIELA